MMVRYFHLNCPNAKDVEASVEEQPRIRPRSGGTFMECEVCGVFFRRQEMVPTYGNDRIFYSWEDSQGHHVEIAKQEVNE